MDFDGKGVAVGFGQELDVQAEEKEDTQKDEADAGGESGEGMAETEVEEFGIAVLESVEEDFLDFFERTHLNFFLRFDEKEGEERDDPDGKEYAAGKSDEDCPGEKFDEVAEIAREQFEHGEEHAADGGGGENHGDEQLAGGLCGTIPAGIAFVEQIGIAVDDDDGIVNDHTQNDNHGGEGDGVEFDAEKEHDAETDSGADGDAGGGDHGGAQGEEDHHHKDDDEDAEEEVFEEAAHALVHDTGLVGDFVEIDIGGDGFADLVDGFVDGFSVGDDVVAWSHFDIEHHTGMGSGGVVIGDELVEFFIAVFDGGDIFETDGLPDNGVVEDDHFAYIIDGVDRAFDMDEGVAFGAIDAAGDGAEALCGELCGDEFFVDGVLAEMVNIEGDGYFFVSVAQDLDAACLWDGAESVVELLGVGCEFAWRMVVAFDGQQHGGGVSEIVDDGDGDNALRQLGLFHEGETPTDFGPGGIFVIDGAFEGREDEGNAVPTVGIGGIVVDVFEGEKIVFEWFGDLIFNFFGGRSRIDGRHDTCADGDLRKFVFVHDKERIDAKEEKDRYDIDNQRMVAHSRFDVIAFFHLTISPSTSF